MNVLVNVNLYGVKEIILILVFIDMYTQSEEQSNVLLSYDGRENFRF